MFSCQQEKQEDVTELSKEELAEKNLPPIIPDPTHNSRNSLDWGGTYVGTLPCADCDGIATELTIRTEGTYTYKTHYLGTASETFETTGSFEWDESGSKITLLGLAGGTGAYKVGENRIWHLDKAGNRIEGDLAERYILEKQ